MIEKPVGIAIVGIGMWCKALATVMQKSGLFRMVTCFTRNAEKRKAFAEKHECDQAGDEARRPDLFERSR